MAELRLGEVKQGPLLHTVLELRCQSKQSFSRAHVESGRGPKLSFGHNGLRRWYSSLVYINQLSIFYALSKRPCQPCTIHYLCWNANQWESLNKWDEEGYIYWLDVLGVLIFQVLFGSHWFLDDMDALLHIIFAILSSMTLTTSSLC